MEESIIIGVIFILLLSGFLFAIGKYIGECFVGKIKSRRERQLRQWATEKAMYKEDRADQIIKLAAEYVDFVLNGKQEIINSQDSV